jgi:hypothetical protein
MAPVSEKQHPTQSRKGSSLHRSQRVLLAVPIVLMGSTEEGKPFSEETITHVVNAHGALVALGTKVFAGQKLSMVNLSSGEELSCIVIHNGAATNGKTEIGLEFTAPAPFFWRISFPPSDWVPRASP